MNPVARALALVALVALVACLTAAVACVHAPRARSEVAIKDGVDARRAAARALTEAGYDLEAPRGQPADSTFSSGTLQTKWRGGMRVVVEIDEGVAKVRAERATGDVVSVVHAPIVERVVDAIERSAGRAVPPKHYRIEARPR